jgi:raffinose/stachyose/melibiose transport system permease protein
MSTAKPPPGTDAREETTAAAAGARPGPAQPAGPGRRPLKGDRAKSPVPLWWALPGVAFVAAFIYLAFFADAWYSFTNWTGTGPAQWVGLSNFRGILTDPIARGALWHTVELTVAFVIAANLIGLGLALALHRTVRSRNVLRVLFFAPVVLSPLAVSYIWQFIFSYTGPLNGLLGSVGLGSWKRDWLGDPSWALWTVLVVLIWGFTGLSMTLYLAGLQGIAEEIDEAAAVDGASTWFRLRRLTIPLLAPSVTISVTLTTISGLRVFDQVIGLTGGGPADATETLATQLYQQGFANGRAGYGAALGVMLTALIAVVAVAQVLVLRRREARL